MRPSTTAQVCCAIHREGQPTRKSNRRSRAANGQSHQCPVDPTIATSTASRTACPGSEPVCSPDHRQPPRRRSASQASSVTDDSYRLAPRRSRGMLVADCHPPRLGVCSPAAALFSCLSGCAARPRVSRYLASTRAPTKFRISLILMAGFCVGNCWLSSFCRALWVLVGRIRWCCATAQASVCTRASAESPNILVEESRSSTTTEHFGVTTRFAHPIMDSRTA